MGERYDLPLYFNSIAGNTMPYFDRLEFPRRHALSATLKFALFVIVILAIVGKNFWVSNQKKSFVVSKVNIMENSRTTADVEFTVLNPKGYPQTKEFLIKVYDIAGQEIGSKILRLELPEKSNTRFRKVISKFKRNLMIDEKLTKAEVILFIPSIF